MDRTRKREAGPGLELIKKGPSPPRKPVANHIALLTRLSRGIKTAARRTGIPKTISCHTLRHSFATHMLRAGTDVRMVQKLMGHKSIRTTMIYLHPDQRNTRLTSPLDLLSDD